MNLFRLGHNPISGLQKKQSSALWYKELTDVVIFVPEGWNHGWAGNDFDRAWLEPITKEEFLRRRAESVCLNQPK